MGTIFELKMILKESGNAQKQGQLLNVPSDPERKYAFSGTVQMGQP